MEDARMGDPETQAVMPRIKNDFVELLVAAAKGDLKNKSVDIDEHHAVTVALVSGGYPGEYKTGKSIVGLEKDAEALIFHAGTKKQNNNVLTDGGASAGYNWQRQFLGRSPRPGLSNSSSGLLGRAVL